MRPHRTPRTRVHRWRRPAVAGVLAALLGGVVAYGLTAGLGVAGGSAGSAGSGAAPRREAAPEASLMPGYADWAASRTPGNVAPGSGVSSSPIVTPKSSPASSPARRPATRRPATPSRRSPPSGIRPALVRSPPVWAPAGRSRGYAFPVTPVGDAWFAHSHHDYPATDIMASCGDTYRAPTAGTVVGVSRVDQWDPNVNAGATRGGLSVTLRGEDGVRYYGSHLQSIAPGIAPGRRVAAGGTLGRVGDTGDARGGACHVHFGISPPCGAGNADWWNRRGVLYPWPYLESWRAGGQRSPAADVRAWQAAHGCPAGPVVDP